MDRSSPGTRGGPEESNAEEAGTLEITGTTTEHVGEVAFARGLPLHELSTHRASLEDAFMSLTQDDVEFRAHATAATTERAENR